MTTTPRNWWSISMGIFVTLAAIPVVFYLLALEWVLLNDWLGGPP